MTGATGGGDGVARANWSSVATVPWTWLCGALLVSAFSGLPLVLSGGLKIVYDLALLYTCRHVKPPEESPGNSA